MELVAVIVVIALGLLAWSQLKRKARKLPPGPYPLPIVGNIFQLSSPNIHESFAELSKKYGPLMSIRLGSNFNVIVSSPEMAKEVLTTQGFLGRPDVQAVQAHDHNKLSVGFMPVTNKKWRSLRKICQEQMFANHNLEKSQPLRHEKLLQLLDYLQKCCDAGRAVDIRSAMFTTSLNLMSVTLFSANAADFDSKLTAEFMEIIMCLSTIVAAPNYADYFPILKYLDPQGVRRKADLQYGRMIRHIQKEIDQRLKLRRENPNHPKPDDFLEKLVDITLGRDYDLNVDDITHLLVDLYVAGSESTIMSIEWLMVELLKHPTTLTRVKNELRDVLGDRKVITESDDISRLPYLQAVVKESFRLHPPGPLLFPREATEDTEIGGYFIPKGTHVHVNAWGMGRDPSIWPNPECFEPERFLNKNIDYKGQHFELIPFGSGKRICAGWPISHRIIHSAVAAMVHNFDWKFAAGESERNGELLCGAALRREAPLMLNPLKKP